MTYNSQCGSAAGIVHNTCCPPLISTSFARMEWLPTRHDSATHLHNPARVERAAEPQHKQAPIVQQICAVLMDVRQTARHSWRQHHPATCHHTICLAILLRCRAAPVAGWVVQLVAVRVAASQQLLHRGRHHCMADRHALVRRHIMCTAPVHHTWAAVDACLLQIASSIGVPRKHNGMAGHLSK